MTSTNVGKELHVVGPTRTASTQMDLTIARAREDLPEIHPDVFKCLACVLMEQYVIETVNVNMSEEIAIRKNSAINLCRVRFKFESFFNLDVNVKWDGLAMDNIARLTKILMDGRITISAAVIHVAVLITAV